MRDTGYGSDSFLRACRIAPACREIEGRGPRAVWARLRAGSLIIAWYRFRLPRVDVRLTESSGGKMIGEHFSIRDRGDWRFRHAQGVLALPADFADYMRGRSRQAVRTNVAHARKAGLRVVFEPLPWWKPGEDDIRAGQISVRPVERWTVVDADGALLGDSILSVDDEVALLHGLISHTSHARWLLHTAIVERLCGSCDLLLTNSDDAYLMGSGSQYFQRLLGYRIARLRLIPSRRAQDVAPAPATEATLPVPEQTPAPGVDEVVPSLTPS